MPPFSPHRLLPDHSNPHVAFFLKLLGHADATGSGLYVEKHRYKILYKQVHIAGVAQRFEAAKDQNSQWNLTRTDH